MEMIVETEKGPGRGPALNPNMGVDGVKQQSKLRVKTASYLVILVKFCLKPDLV